MRWRPNPATPASLYANLGTLYLRRERPDQTLELANDDDELRRAVDRIPRH